MNIIFILIDISLILALIFLSAFYVSLKSGQFDDPYSPAVRILKENKSKKSSKDAAADN